MIDSYKNENIHILGETAVSDLWLLSHSHAFVGHLGSRFGKAAWLLATARHNTFIPFLLLTVIVSIIQPEKELTNSSLFHNVVISFHSALTSFLRYFFHSRSHSNKVSVARSTKTALQQNRTLQTWKTA